MNRALINKANDLVYQYSVYDSLSESYVISYEAIDENDLMQLAALFIQSDGPDAYLCIAENRLCDTDIMPAVMGILFKPGSAEALWNLKATLQQEIVAYYKTRTLNLLEEALSLYTWDRAKDPREYVTYYDENGHAIT